VNFLRLKGTSRKTRVIAEDDGSVAGVHEEHWDDSQAAVAFPRLDRLNVPPHGLLFPGHGLLVPGDTIGFRKGKPVKVVAGGAWTASGLYVLNWIDLLDATQLAIDLSLTSHKIAMYNNTETPNFSTEDGYAVTNEVSGTGYTAGGQVVVSPTVTESPAGTIMYDLGDQVWASPTTVTARGAKEYADALVGNDLIVGINFGADITSTASTFTIAFNALGVLTLDVTP
jgi:hypothetical protein